MDIKSIFAAIAALPADHQPTGAVQTGLMAAQLEGWENTVFLTDQELIDGLSQRSQPHAARTVRQYRAHYPEAVAYSVVDGTGMTCYGMRYGFRGEQYISF